MCYLQYIFSLLITNKYSLYGVILQALFYIGFSFFNGDGVNSICKKSVLVLNLFTSKNRGVGSVNMP